MPISAPNAAPNAANGSSSHDRMNIQVATWTWGRPCERGSPTS